MVIKRSITTPPFPRYPGSFNTANGVQALFSNTTGASNTANGYRALYSNTTGANNTADGLAARQQHNRR